MINFKELDEESKIDIYNLLKPEYKDILKNRFEFYFNMLSYKIFIKYHDQLPIDINNCIIEDNVKLIKHKDGSYTCDNYIHEVGDVITNQYTKLLKDLDVITYIEPENGSIKIDDQSIKDSIGDYIHVVLRDMHKYVYYISKTAIIINIEYPNLKRVYSPKAELLEYSLKYNIKLNEKYGIIRMRLNEE